VKSSQSKWSQFIIGIGLFMVGLALVVAGVVMVVFGNYDTTRAAVIGVVGVGLIVISRLVLTAGSPTE
jgi:Na+/phosphate symporter